MTRLALIAGFAALSLSIAMIGSIFVPDLIDAQGEDGGYVDVGLILEVPEDFQANVHHTLNIIVVNNGTRTAYDVEVVVKVESPVESRVSDIGLTEAPLGRMSLDGRSLRWSIPALGGLKREEFTGFVTHKSSDPAFDNSLIPHKLFGEITTSSFDRNSGNNTTRIWSYSNIADGSYFRQVGGNYSVNVSVDNAVPSPGGTVNFTITADRANPYGTATDSASVPPPIDLKVDIALTGGLSVDDMGTISYAPTTNRADSVSYSSGVFTIGTLNTGKARKNSVTLPVSVSSTAVVNEQCLTATLTGNPPPGTGPLNDDISDNVAKVCLGGSVEPFISGQVDAFTLYPCVGITDAPCDSADDIRVRAETDAFGTPLTTGTAVFWIDPLKGRIYDGHTNTSNVLQSVNDGNTVSWQTAVSAGRPYEDGLTSGVEIYYSRTPFDSHTADWKRPLLGISARNVLGSVPPPGKVFLRSTTSGNEFRKAESPAYEEVPTNLSTSAITAIKFHYFLEFEKLGTYKITWHSAANRSTLHGSEDCHPNTADPPVNQAFCATETYTFHVGPMRDLAVEDGGASSYVASDENALTVVAINNGPTDSPGAKVTSLPTGAEVIHISQGTYDGSAGEWNIGELKVRGYYRSRGEPDPTLVLSASADDTADVSIAHPTYEVCIGGKDNPGDLAHTTKAACEADTATGVSWHSTPVYDYNEDNDTATLTARAGGNHPDAPTLQAPAVHAPAVGVSWSEVKFLYGLPVKDYQVQWSTNGVSGWTQIETDLTLPKLFDITIQSGQTRHYRVRAVNEAGVPGPWSKPMSALAEEAGVPGVRVSVTELELAEGGGGADYTVSLNARPISNVAINIGVSGDVTANPRRLVFTPVNWETAQTVTLTAGQDPDGDNDTLEVTHNISTGDAEYARLTAPTVAVTVIDDDSGVSIAADQESINEGETVTFTLTRQGNTDNLVAVVVNVAQRGDFLVSGEAGQRTFEMGGDPATFVVDTVNDSIVENAGSVTVSVSAGTDYFVGSPSSVTVRVQDDDGVPGQPANLTADEGNRQINLSWSAAPVSDSRVLDYSYRVRRSDRSTWDPDWTVLAAGSGRRSHAQSGLINGQEYVFQVRARNDTGNGAVAEVRATPRTTPGRPDVTVTSRNESLLVTWDVPDDGGSPTTQYKVQWKVGSQSSYAPSDEDTATDGEYTISALKNDTEYRVRVQAMNEAGWSGWSSEQPGTPLLRPATSLRITTDAEDGVDKPFRVTFTFTDEDYDGTRYGVTGFDVDDIFASYGPSVFGFTLTDFRVERPGFVYSALVEKLVDGTLRISVDEGVAQSTHSDGQENTSAGISIDVDAPDAKEPTGTKIWSAEMTVGEYPGNARGYIDHRATRWEPDEKIGHLSANTFSYAGVDYMVGELSYVPAWNVVIYILCPGLKGADRSFDLYLDDQVDDHRDLSLSFDADEFESTEFNKTIDGDDLTCVEYIWGPKQTDWQTGGKVNVSLIK